MKNGYSSTSKVLPMLSKRALSPEAKFPLSQDSECFSPIEEGQKLQKRKRSVHKNLVLSTNFVDQKMAFRDKISSPKFRMSQDLLATTREIIKSGGQKQMRRKSRYEKTMFKVPLRTNSLPR